MSAADMELQLSVDSCFVGGREVEARETFTLYRSMRTARCIDELEREFIARGEAFFCVSSAGHESSASLAALLQAEDYLHCHYRDKALLLARGMPVAEFFNSLFCNRESHSAGRQMSAHLSAPELNVLSVVGPVGNHALQSVGIAQALRRSGSNAIVLCSLGDGTTQQGEVLEAIAEAVRSSLAVFFLIQDNRYSISTPTEGKTFYSTPTGPAESFYGIPIHRIDGTDALSCREAFRPLVATLRAGSGPVLCVMSVERLTSHTNADDDTIYRDPDHVRRLWEFADPVARLREDLLRTGVSKVELDRLDEFIVMQTRSVAEAALANGAPRAEFGAKRSVPRRLTDRAREYLGSEADRSLTMAQALRETLRLRMSTDERVTLYGEDIEDPKGDVFGVTRGLSSAFPGRVSNSPLSESTIVGACIGRALAGGRPVAFMQFADFLPLAFNQIATELGSLHWRTQGAWQAPVIVLAACGGYRPGLGPFHAHTFDTTFAHLPGLDVAMPSTAADAAGLLNAAFEIERPTVLLYPKALLNDPTRGTSADIARHWVALETARVLRTGTDITLVGWGNTVPYCERVAQALAAAGASAEVLDLRWLAPWDRQSVCRSVTKTRRLLVVHEDNVSAGFGAEVLATVTESIEGPIRARRVARADTFIPCHFGNQLEVLPSFRSTLDAAARLLDMKVEWESPPACETNILRVDLVGSSPADQTVSLVELHVAEADVVRAGQILATVEGDKAISDVASPADGIVDSVHRRVGESVSVGAALLSLRVSQSRQRQPCAERELQPNLRRKAARSAISHIMTGRHAIALSGLGSVRGDHELHNSQLVGRFPQWCQPGIETDGLLDRTGIESRRVASESQDAVSMAVQAATRALSEALVSAADLSLIICSTSTPTMISPSTACQILKRLAPDSDVTAYDLQAACSGYLYALASAWDFLQVNPDARVLVLTTETMRRIVDIDDPDTSPIFGDAATASVLTTTSGTGRQLARICRPVLGASGEDGSALRVPLPHDGSYVRMDGRRVFAEAVRRMRSSLDQACGASGLTVADLDVIVPHQANGRIIEAMQARLGIPPERVWNEIRFQGNTSSSSIPLALDTVLRRTPAASRIGLCTFGAGYTFGGAVLLT